MDELTETPILKFNKNQMVQVRKSFNYDDVNRLHQDINLLEDWIRKQNHFVVKEYDKEYLERYLINSKGLIEQAKKRLDKLCTLRGLMPEYLQGFDIKNEFQFVLKISHACVLPKPTPDNYRVFFTTAHNPEAADTFDFLHFSRYMMVLLEYLYCHDYNVGLEIIIDTRNYTFGVITKLNPIVIANTVMLMTEARGLRIKALHLISGSKFLDTVVAIVKQGLTKKLVSRLHIHDNNESLYRLVPRDILPKEYGGDQPTLKEINESNFKELSSVKHINRMKFMESAVTNESQRLSSKFNEEYSGMPGSFKVLNVD
ncbi:alpha-tocopherol transfer protein-like [Epargyreus clarus]|uniref:alpha-tocopherol transfer protein-like n=1 Tax=Epargyreus clarus TaxID=520877 RepID=UPI003C306AB6